MCSIRLCPSEKAATNTSWIYNLQQDQETRSNVAIVNTGENSPDTDVFSIEIFDGQTGLLANAIDGVSVGARDRISIGCIYFPTLLPASATAISASSKQVEPIRLSLTALLTTEASPARGPATEHTCRWTPHPDLVPPALEVGESQARWDRLGGKWPSSCPLSFARAQQLT